MKPHSIVSCIALCAMLSLHAVPMSVKAEESVIAEPPPQQSAARATLSVRASELNAPAPLDELTGSLVAGVAALAHFVAVAVSEPEHHGVRVALRVRHDDRARTRDVGVS